MVNKIAEKLKFVFPKHNFLTSFKKHSHIGLDIGTSSIKLVVLEEKAKQQKILKKFSYMAITAGNDLAGIVDSFIKKEGIAGALVNVSVSGPSVIMRYLIMPKMDMTELKKAIKFEIKEHIPFSLDEIVVDCAILKERIENNKMLVGLAAVKKVMLQERLSLLEKVGVIPQVVDIDCFCLANVFNNSRQFNTKDQTKENKNDVSETQTAKPEVAGLLNIGSRFTNMAIVENGILNFSRDIGFGGGELTLNNLVNEISSSIDYYENQSGLPIEKIYLSGGAGQFPNVANFIKEQLDVSILNLEISSGILFDEQVNKEEFRAKENLFAIALGLALR